jgi:hypothetical protein
MDKIIIFAERKYKMNLNKGQMAALKKISEFEIVTDSGYIVTNGYVAIHSEESFGLPQCNNSNYRLMEDNHICTYSPEQYNSFVDKILRFFNPRFVDYHIVTSPNDLNRKNLKAYVTELIPGSKFKGIHMASNYRYKDRPCENGAYQYKYVKLCSDVIGKNSRFYLGTRGGNHK